MIFGRRKPAPPPLDIAAMIRTSLAEAMAMEAAQKAAAAPEPPPAALSAPCPQCQSPFSLLATNEAGLVAMVLGLGDAPLGPMRTCCGCGTRYFVTTDGAHKFGEKLQRPEPQVREPRPTNGSPRYPQPDADMAAGFANREP